MRTWPRAVAWKNTAVGGQTVEDIARHAVDRVDSFYSVQGRRNVVVAWAGTNDIALWDHAVALIFAELRQYALERRQRGFTVVVMTTITRSDTFSSAYFEPHRQELNSLIRDNWESFADLLIDVAADPRWDRSAPNATARTSLPTAST